MARPLLCATFALLASTVACGGRTSAPPASSPEAEGAGSPLPASVRATNDVEYHFDALTQTSGGIQVDGWAFIEKTGAKDSVISIVLRGRNGTQLVFKGWPVARHDVSEYHKNADLDDSGFTVWIPRSALGRGEYQVGVYIRRQGRDALEFTPQVVRID